MKVGSVLGLVREATVKSVDVRSGKMLVKLGLSQSDVVAGKESEFEVPISGSWMGPDGQFSGGCPVIGSTIWVARGQGGRWAPLSYVPNDDVFSNTNTSGLNGFRRNKMIAFRPGRWLSQVANDIRLFADPVTGIEMGDPNERYCLDPLRKISSVDFRNHFIFTDASRNIDGAIKRDLASNSNRDVSGDALTSHNYDDALFSIGLDPLTKAGLSAVRNPPLAEKRELVYEFCDSFGFTDDTDEATRYDTGEPPELPASFSRRDSRADTLSLSLIQPNQLLETIKGTLVDIFGNILDINRAVLPNGTVDELSFRSTDVNRSDVFTKLREQTRKSIAYHFEINSRKPFPLQETNNTDDYARGRSKFCIDIDKEGQFKMNVPASSEVGNVSLLTRYENFSTLKALEEDTDPRSFVRSANGQDIFAEGFGVQSVSLSGGEDELEGKASPSDRLTEEPIKLGTAFHDILNTVNLHTRIDAVTSYNEDTLIPIALPDTEDEDGNTRPAIVNNNVIVSGDNANAGGRSGTISLDGSLSMSIGANTVDRQSMWIDTAGGVVANYGRDLNNISYAATYDGDIFVQVGAATVANDSRFAKINNTDRPGTVDIRVRGGAGDQAGGTMTVVRIDPTGVQVSTPGRVDIVSRQNLRIKSGADLILDAENIYLYGDETGNGRLVNRKTKQTI